MSKEAMRTLSVKFPAKERRHLDRLAHLSGGALTRGDVVRAFHKQRGFATWLRRASIRALLKSRAS